MRRKMIANINCMCYSHNRSLVRNLRDRYSMIILTLCGKNIKPREVRWLCPDLPANAYRDQRMNFVFPILNHTFLVPVLDCCSRDRGSQFPHLVMEGLDLKCSSITGTHMLSFSWRFYKQHYSHLKHLQKHYLWVCHMFSTEKLHLFLHGVMCKEFFFVVWCLRWSISYDFMFLICHITS